MCTQNLGLHWLPIARFLLNDIGLRGANEGAEGS